MSMEYRVEALKAKHRELEDALQLENRRPDPDDHRIAELKKAKLRIKDEIVNSHHA